MPARTFLNSHTKFFSPLTSSSTSPTKQPSTTFLTHLSFSKPLTSSPPLDDTPKQLHQSQILPRHALHHHQIIKPPKNVAQSRVQLSHGQCLAQEVPASFAEGDHASLLHTNSLFIVAVVKYPAFWIKDGLVSRKGDRVVVHQPGGHGDGCSWRDGDEVESGAWGGDEAGEMAWEAGVESQRLLNDPVRYGNFSSARRLISIASEKASLNSFLNFP